MFTVYALVSESTGKIYVGQTADLKMRLLQHNAIGAEHLGRYTKQNKGPWVLVHKEDFESRTEAIRREKQLKSYRGRQFIKNLISHIRP